MVGLVGWVGVVWVGRERCLSQSRTCRVISAAATTTKRKGVGQVLLLVLHELAQALEVEPHLRRAQHMPMLLATSP